MEYVCRVRGEIRTLVLFVKVEMNLELRGCDVLGAWMDGWTCVRLSP